MEAGCDKAGFYRTDASVMNVSVIEGEGLVNGQMIRKGDHFILPAGIGTVDFQGDMSLILSSTK